MTATLGTVHPTCPAVPVGGAVGIDLLTGTRNTAVRAHDGGRLARLADIALRGVAARPATWRRSAGCLTRTGRLRRS